MLSSTDEAVRECIDMIEKLQGLPNSNLTYNLEFWILIGPYYTNTYLHNFPPASGPPTNEAIQQVKAKLQGLSTLILTCHWNFLVSP